MAESGLKNEYPNSIKENLGNETDNGPCCQTLEI